MHLFASPAIQSWERFYRSNFINSLTGFKSVSLVGTASQKGETNLAIFSSIVHIGSDPPLVGFINRPDRGLSHTLANIKATGYYTLNHIHPSFLDKAHQTSVKYLKEVSEFEAVGLTPEYLERIAAPFVKESRVKYALSLEEIIPIHLNDTSLVIGKVICVSLEEEILLADGFLQLDQSPSLCGNGNDGYYATELRDRLGHAT